MRLKHCHNFHDYRELAKRRLPGPIFNYIDGAADDELTCRRNTQADESVDLVPNVLRGVEDVDYSEGPACGLLGGHLAVLPNASKLKAKLQSIWIYSVKEAEKAKSKVPLAVAESCLRQLKEYECTKKADKDASNKQKDRDAIIQREMKEYQKWQGAIPPSAKGK